MTGGGGGGGGGEGGGGETYKDIEESVGDVVSPSRYINHIPKTPLA